jgi:hypothetical protein
MLEADYIFNGTNVQVFVIDSTGDDNSKFDNVCSVCFILGCSSAKEVH